MPRTNNVTSVTATGCPSGRVLCHPPGPVRPVRVRTRLRHRSWPQLLAGPGDTRPDLSESRGGLGANGGLLSLCWAGGPCATGSYPGLLAGVLDRLSALPL
jgi:hypothetical protein